ncbi:MAG: Nramp family divalent metal transporter [Pirellulaceae bacterium]
MSVQEHSSQRADTSVPIVLTENPPHTFKGILQRLGPGLIIAGSIVGSGELIATTATGAEAGFWLLWLILIGCIIKVFCQVELGRYTIVTGKTTMSALADVPGPRVCHRANWLTAYWLIMFLVSLGQLGGIVGGVGQALQISWPLTDTGRAANQQSQQETRFAVLTAQGRRLAQTAATSSDSGSDRSAELEMLGRHILAERLDVARQQAQGSPATAAALQRLEARVARWPAAPDRVYDPRDPELAGMSKAEFDGFKRLGKLASTDDRIWAAIVTVITSALLVIGRYGLVQSFSTFLVAGFTLVTVVNVCMLQMHPTWAVGWQDLVDGLSFRLPPGGDGASPEKAMATALATFGIIGVGANELIQYPYWCVEKGYARFTGPRDDSPEWAERARGWLRVLRWDAWCSMVVYTFATLAFYLLGAAVLGRTGLIPEGQDMIQTLSVMYEPVFGVWARWVFLFGAFAVLYSTFFVATAGHARVFPEGLQVFGIGPQSQAGYRRCVSLLSMLFPFLCLSVYLLFPAQPKALILLSGSMQGIMLPMLAGAAIYFRYYRSDARLLPGRLWDAFLWVSGAGMLVTGSWSVWSEISKLLK